MNPELKKRFLSLLWHTGAVAVVGLATFFIDPQVIAAMHIPQWVVIFIGLIVGQVTKYLNTSR